MAINAFNKKAETNTTNLNAEAEVCRNIIADQRRMNNRRMNAIIDI